jgi:hypothetical protein
MANKVTFSALLLLACLAPRGDERPTKTVELTEDLYFSRSCPDDVKGDYPQNRWRITASDEDHVTVTCTYKDWDDEAEAK